MTDYHFHHPEKMFTDRAELLEIIAGQRLMTLAMAKDGQPYLITVNYGFDAEQTASTSTARPRGRSSTICGPTRTCGGRWSRTGAT